jgi:hypothetical protein
MPVEISLVSDEPVTSALVFDAAASVDATLAPRLLNGGWAMQLVDTDDVPVLTVELSRFVDDPYDVERLTGPLSGIGPVWWTEATAPWGAKGGSGVRIARALGVLLDARVVVADGR